MLVVYILVYRVALWFTRASWRASTDSLTDPSLAIAKLGLGRGHNGPPLSIECYIQRRRRRSRYQE